MIDLSLILPSFNEKENLLIYIPILQKLFQKHNITYEIIVVDDDSEDLTWKAIQDIFSGQDDVRVIRRIGKKGLSSAVIDGMAIAKGRYFGVMDADMQHDEGIIPQMLAELKTHEIVVGSRLVGDGGYGEWGFTRKMMSKAATWMAKIFLPIEVKDPMSGFFIITRELFEELGNKINPRGFKILLEFLGRKKGIRSKEVGYVFKTRIHGTTKMSGSVIQNYLAALYDIRFGKYISLIFVSYIIIGFIGFLVSVLAKYLLSFVWLEKSISIGFVQLSNIFLIAFIISILNNYLLNNLLTFRRVQIRGFIGNLGGLMVFSFISAIGLFIQMSVWNYSLEIFKMLYPTLTTSYLANHVFHFLGIVLATATNFYLNKNFTWRWKD